MTTDAHAPWTAAQYRAAVAGKPKPWKRPPDRDWSPEPGDVGTTVTYHGQHGREEGQVWSLAYGGCVWVVPFDNPGGHVLAVLVSKHGFIRETTYRTVRAA